MLKQIQSLFQWLESIQTELYIFLSYSFLFCVSMSFGNGGWNYLKRLNCRKHSSLRSMYKLDDSEMMGLLENAVERKPSVEKRETYLDHGIRCQKCGFSNPPSATVCRDCNNLLRGNETFALFSTKKYPF